MTRKEIGISNEAVRKATGKDWPGWEKALDAWGASDLPHKEIVELLRDRGGIGSGWWQQSVAVGYEKLKGRRITGETEGTGFQVGVQRTLPISGEAAWRLLTSGEGLRAWLGEGEVPGIEEGERYRLKDGAEGEVRVVRPGRHLRITWHPPGWPRPSTIQVRVEARGDRAVIGFHQEHLPGSDEREERRQHFRSALAALSRQAG